jgi:tetratricopeptide (TPR) repeat protein
MARAPEQKPTETTGNVISDLMNGHLPPWLRPLPYQGIMSMIGGFEGESVRVFEVVDEQPPALAACRLAEYLVETGRTDQMTAVVKVLRNYSGDLAALVAMMQMQLAQKDFSAAKELLNQVLARLAVGADRSLVWDRRVGLAVILAQAKRPDQARDQARRCLAEMNPRRLRTLTDNSLFNFQVVVHRLGLDWPDPKLRELSLELLPPEFRARLLEQIQGDARP